MATVNGSSTLMEKAKAVTTAPTTTQTAPKPKTIRDYIGDMAGEIMKAVPKHVDPNRVARIALTAINSNPKLLECTRNSLLACIMTGAQLGFELNTPLGLAYMIPRKKSFKNADGTWGSTMEASFQLGYQGILKLAYNSKEFQTIEIREVYEKDVFEYEYGFDQKLKHKESEEEDRGKLRYIYGTYTTKDGGRYFEVWPINKIIAHAKKYSDMWNDKKSEWVGGENCVWVSDLVSMGKKTVMKSILKYAPKSVEIMEQINKYDSSDIDRSGVNLVTGEIVEAHRVEQAPEPAQIEEMAA